MITPSAKASSRPKSISPITPGALAERYQQNPERFVKGRPAVQLPQAFVAINPIPAKNGGNILEDRVNFPTLTAASFESPSG